MRSGQRPYYLIAWLIPVALAAAWVWGGALLVRGAGQEALARAGWAGTPGVVRIGQCRTETVDVETNTTQTDCAASFTPGGDGRARTVKLANTGKPLARGSTAAAVVVGDVAFLPSWWFFLTSVAGVLFFGVLGGVPLMVPAALLYRWAGGPDRDLSVGLAATLLCLVAVAGECAIAYLLSR